MSSLFKDVYPDGTVKYHDNDRYYCIKWDDPNLCWHNGFIGKIYSEMFPLTMPYMPSNKADVIVCDELLTDRKNGDFDTLAVLYIQRSHGEKVEVNKAMIDQCDAIYVLLHSENSVGTKKEIEYAKSTCKQVIYQQEAETKEKEWGWKKDPYIYPRSFYSPVGYTPWDPWGRRL